MNLLSKIALFQDIPRPSSYISYYPQDNETTDALNRGWDALQRLDRGISSSAGTINLAGMGAYNTYRWNRNLNRAKDVAQANPFNPVLARMDPRFTRYYQAANRSAMNPSVSVANAITDTAWNRAMDKMVSQESPEDYKKRYLLEATIRNNQDPAVRQRAQQQLSELIATEGRKGVSTLNQMYNLGQDDRNIAVERIKAIKDAKAEWTQRHTDMETGALRDAEQRYGMWATAPAAVAEYAGQALPYAALLRVAKPAATKVTAAADKLIPGIGPSLANTTKYVLPAGMTLANYNILGDALGIRPGSVAGPGVQFGVTIPKSVDSVLSNRDVQNGAAFATSPVLGNATRAGIQYLFKRPFDPATLAAYTTHVTPTFNSNYTTPLKTWWDTGNQEGNVGTLLNKGLSTQQPLMNIGMAAGVNTAARNYGNPWVNGILKGTQTARMSSDPIKSFVNNAIDTTSENVGPWIHKGVQKVQDFSNNINNKIQNL